MDLLCKGRSNAKAGGETWNLIRLNLPTLFWCYFKQNRYKEIRNKENADSNEYGIEINAGLN
jgi:hypothetical protein